MCGVRGSSGKAKNLTTKSIYISVRVANDKFAVALAIIERNIHIRLFIEVKRAALDCCTATADFSFYLKRSASGRLQLAGRIVDIACNNQRSTGASLEHTGICDGADEDYCADAADRVDRATGFDRHRAETDEIRAVLKRQDRAGIYVANIEGALVDDIDPVQRRAVTG